MTDAAADLEFSATEADLVTLGAQGPNPELTTESLEKPARREISVELRTIVTDRWTRLRGAVEAVAGAAGKARETSGEVVGAQGEEGAAASAAQGAGAEAKSSASSGSTSRRLPAGWRPAHVYAGVGALAALVAVAGTIAFWPVSKAPPTSAASEPGLVDGQSGVMAPAAKLAGVTPSEGGARPIVQLPRLEPNHKVVEEVQSFFDKAGTVADGGGKDEQKSTAAGSGTVAKSAAPATSSGPASEVGVRPVSVAPEQPKPLAKVATAAVGGSSDSSPKAQAPDGQVTSSSNRGAGEAVATKKAEEPARVNSLEPQAAERSEAPKALSAEKEIKLYGMITELSTLVRRTREEVVALREEQKKGGKEIDGKLLDFERRLNLSEAQRALDAAENVRPKTSEPSITPAIYTPPPKPAAAAAKGLVTASLPAATDASAAVAPAAHYRVQAASPGLAMLMDVDRSGEGVAPLQVAVGGTVPGYGRVTKISQRGIEWVVLTEKGPIH